MAPYSIYKLLGRYEHVHNRTLRIARSVYCVGRIHTSYPVLLTWCLKSTHSRSDRPVEMHFKFVSSHSELEMLLGKWGDGEPRCDCLIQNCPHPRPNGLQTPRWSREEQIAVRERRWQISEESDMRLRAGVVRYHGIYIAGLSHVYIHRHVWKESVVPCSNGQACEQERVSECRAGKVQPEWEWFRIE